MVGQILILGGIFFLSAGTWDLPWAQAYWGVWILGMVPGVIVMLKYPHIRALVKERIKPGSGNAKERLWVLMTIGLLIIIPHYALAGLDTGRFHWSDTVPEAMRVVALVALAAGIATTLWVIVKNPFASSIVRLQEDRGQYVVTDGPYRFVRHPMYVGVLLWFFVGSFALGSWVAMIPMAFAAPLLAFRTAREDRYLIENLEGYRKYAERTRYRLLPGVW